MPEIQSNPEFYSPLPLFGKRLNFQWGNFRQDFAVLKAVARAQVQDVETGDDFVNADRVLAGLEFGEQTSNTVTFKNQFRLFYDKTLDKFCIQRNTGTELVPVWVDYLCIDQVTGMVTVIGLDAGALGIGSEGGFYGLPDQRMQRIAEIGAEAATSFSPPFTDALFFNTSDFYLTPKKGNPFRGTAVVNAKNSFGLSRIFSASGGEWIINHNFGISPVMVQVFDDQDRVIIPGEADVSDPNTAFFYFDSSINGRVIVSTGALGAAELLPLDPFYLLVRHTDNANVPRLTPFADLLLDPEDFYVNYKDDNKVFISLGDRFANLSTIVDSIVSAAANPGFYGITVKHSNDSQSFRGINVIAFNSNDFYVTQNSPNTDEVVVNFRGSVGSGSGVTDHGALTGLGDDDHTQYLLRTETPPGFYGIFVRESDGNPPTFKKDTLIFDSADFYLHSDSTGKPTVSLRNQSTTQTTTTVISSTNAAAFVHTQGIAAVEWTINHNLNNKNLIVQAFNNDDRVIGFDEADTSGPNTAFFYFSSAVSGKAVVMSTDITSADAANFYGITVKHSNDSESLSGINVVAFDVNDFYITQNVPNTDEVLVSLRDRTPVITDHGALTGLGDDDHTQYLLRTETPPGFYGIFVRESDGNPPTFRNDTLIFDSQAFYLHSDSVNKPTVSLRSIGEVNTASNLGSGSGVFAQKSNVDLQFKSLIAGSNITLTPSANDITIAAIGSGIDLFYSKLSNLEDVQISNPQIYDFLQFYSTEEGRANKWVNRAYLQYAPVTTESTSNIAQIPELQNNTVALFTAREIASNLPRLWVQSGGLTLAGTITTPPPYDLSRDSVTSGVNLSGASITRGQILAPFSSAGAAAASVIRVTLADASSTGAAPAIPAIGVALNGTGVSGTLTMLLRGIVGGLDTSAFAYGALLYVSTTPGAMTTTPPVGPNLRQAIGIVLRSNATTGRIFFNIGLEDRNIQISDGTNAHLNYKNLSVNHDHFYLTRSSTATGGSVINIESNVNSIILPGNDSITTTETNITGGTGLLFPGSTNGLLSYLLTGTINFDDHAGVSGLRQVTIRLYTGANGILSETLRNTWFCNVDFDFNNTLTFSHRFNAPTDAKFGFSTQINADSTTILTSSAANGFSQINIERLW